MDRLVRGAEHCEECFGIEIRSIVRGRMIRAIYYYDYDELWIQKNEEGFFDYIDGVVLGGKQASEEDWHPSDSDEEERTVLDSFVAVFQQAAHVIGV